MCKLDGGENEERECGRRVCVLQKKKTDEEVQAIQHDSELYLVRIASFSIYHVLNFIYKLNSLQCVFVYSYSLQKMSTDEEAQTTT